MIENKKEIDNNKHAWEQLAQEHYEVFKQKLSDGSHQLNRIIKAELGTSLQGKRVIHLQCNTGADTILLARLGASEVVGVDLVPENIHYAQKLASDLGVTNVSFVASDIMTLSDHYHEQFDVVFTSEGAIIWLPNLDRWGQTIRQLLKPQGWLYAFDIHPFFLMFNTEKLPKEQLEIQYPYFDKKPDFDDSIGGYACPEKKGVTAVTWMYTISDLINAIAKHGLTIEYLHEFKENFYNAGAMIEVEPGRLFNYLFNNQHFPMSFSIKASIK